MAEEMPRRLNYGCGFDKRAGYLNVDMDPACAPDVLINGNDLSVLPKAWFDEVLALDVLEHVPRLSTQTMLLEWAELLRDGGNLTLKTSSILGVAERLERTADSFREQFGWTQCLFGSQGHSGDFHYTGFTETTLKVQLAAAGFELRRMWLTDHWLLHAEAVKVSSWTAILDRHAGDDDATFITAVYREGLGRDPEPHSLTTVLDHLATGTWDRRAVVLHVRGSVERLFVVAGRCGLDAVNEQLDAKVARRIPDRWKPPLRWTRRIARSASWHARRALGGLRAR